MDIEARRKTSRQFEASYGHDLMGAIKGGEFRLFQKTVAMADLGKKNDLRTADPGQLLGGETVVPFKYFVVVFDNIIVCDSLGQKHA